MNLIKTYKHKSISIALIILILVNSLLSLKEIFFIQSLSFKNIVTTQFLLNQDENSQSNYIPIDEEICSNDIHISNNSYFVWKTYHEFNLFQTIYVSCYINNISKNFTFYIKEKHSLINISINLYSYNKYTSIRAPPFV